MTTSLTKILVEVTKLHSQAVVVSTINKSDTAVVAVEDMKKSYDLIKRLVEHIHELGDERCRLFENCTELQVKVAQLQKTVDRYGLLLAHAEAEAEVQEEPKEGLEKHIVPLLDQLEEDEEPRESTPVEVLIDAVLRVQEFPSARLDPVGLVDMAREAQAFLDADTSLRELAQYALEDAARELEGKTAVKTVLWQLDKRLQEVLNLHGEENKTD